MNEADRGAGAREIDSARATAPRPRAAMHSDYPQAKSSPRRQVFGAVGQAVVSAEADAIDEKGEMHTPTSRCSQEKCTT